MLRSLFSGISGLRAHQQMMDITANNIANINTTGFKSSQASFEDTLSQMITSAGAPQGLVGGTNPAQLGLGVKLAGIQTNFSQGTAQTTGRATDLMIQGDGFFVVRNNTENMYTRNGSFTFDSDGSLTTLTGAEVQGWVATNGKIDTNSTPTDIKLPVGTTTAPTQTKNVTVGGNLPADTTSTTPITASITTYDQQGNPVNLSTSFTKTSPTSWDVTVSDPNGNTSGAVPVTFNPDGTNPTPTSVTLGNITVDLSGLTSFTGASTVVASKQDGAPSGTLQSFTFSPDGTLMGTFSNGLKEPLAQIAMANFNNPPGLEKNGDSMYRSTVNSGVPQLGEAGSGGRGFLQGGALEMSNVDLAQEFSNLVIAQRGFQANSKVITTSDELLQDLVNIKR